MMFLKVVGWVCVALADFIAILALKDCWFGIDPKSGLAPFFAMFIVLPFALAGLWILGVNVSWNTAWTLVPAFIVIFEGARRLF